MRLGGLLASGFEGWCASHGAPGGALVVWQGGRRDAVFCGLADAAQGTPVEAGTRFNIGSVTKMLVATMALRAVEAGALQLDVPLQSQWPHLPLPGPWADRITLRHLLTHRLGCEGDVFDDTGTGPDALQRFAEICKGLPAPFEPGGVYSYSNVGYALLGRLLELVHRRSWDEALQHSLLDPLALLDTGTPFAAARRPGPQARGHAGAPGAWVPVHNLRLLRANGPCGATVTATLDDLATFGLAHLHTAAGQGGVMGTALHAAMREREVAVPCPNGWTGFGLGLMHFDPAGEVLGHNGAVDGTWTFLRVVPQLEAVIALAVNGGDANGLMAELDATAFPLEGPLHPCRPPALPSEPLAVDTTPFAGRYGSERYHVEVRSGGGSGRLDARFVPSPAARDFGAPFDVKLLADPAGVHGSFIGRMPGSSVASYQAFLPHGGQGAGILNFRGRALPRLT